MRGGAGSPVIVLAAVVVVLAVRAAAPFLARPVRRRRLGGGVLVGIGGLVGLTGLVVVGSALFSATRQWVNQLEQPRSEIARRKWQQARAAASAGAGAWRNGPQT